MPTVEDAVILAATLHKGQKDKAGAAYIFHPLRVMLRLQTEEEQIVGVLHDTLEDCNISPEELRVHGYNKNILEALDFLTKRPEEEEDYNVFIERINQGPELARRVKIADLRDNMDLSRFSHPTEKDYRRKEKYERALAILSST